MHLHFHVCLCQNVILCSGWSKIFLMGCANSKIGIILQFFLPKKCTTIKEFEPPGGHACQVIPWINQCCVYEDVALRVWTHRAAVSVAVAASSVSSSGSGSVTNASLCWRFPWHSLSVPDPFPSVMASVKNSKLPLDAWRLMLGVFIA